MVAATVAVEIGTTCASPYKSRGISAPINAILITMTMIALTSAFASGALIFIYAAGTAGMNSGAPSPSSTSAQILHGAIEAVYLSNPGTSVTVLLKNDRGQIASAPSGNSTTIDFRTTIPAAAPRQALGYALPDPAGIISSIEGGGTIYLNGMNAYAASPTIQNPFTAGEQTIACWVRPNTDDTVYNVGYLSKDYPGDTGELYYEPSLGRNVRRALTGTHSAGYLITSAPVPQGFNGPFAMTTYVKVADNTLNATAWRLEIYEDGALKYSYEAKANQYASTASYQWCESPTWWLDGAKTYVVKVYWPANVGVYFSQANLMARRGGFGYGVPYPSALIFEKYSGGYQAGYYTRKADGTYSTYWTPTDFQADGRWHFVAATLSSDGTKRIYVDGVLKSTVTGALGLYNQNTYFSLGSAGWRNWYGDADDVMFFNRALNATEIGYLYANRQPLNDTGLVAWYRFEEGRAGTSVDSRSGINCTEYNTARSIYYVERAVYSVKMNQFTIPIGVWAITVTKNMDGSLTVEVNAR